MATTQQACFRQVTVWIHDDKFSRDEVLVAPDIFGEDKLPPNTLMEIVLLKPSSDLDDLRDNAQYSSEASESTPLSSTSKRSKGYSEQAIHRENRSIPPKIIGQDATFVPDPRTRYFFIARPMPANIRSEHPTLQVSITSRIASMFGYRPRLQAAISVANPRACSASHVELIFRDEYLSRSDMWRLVRSELAGKTVHKGQKILFLGTIKAIVKTIYVGGRKASSAYFCENTAPVFRSESARYVLFVQMSREMWDFDSEGTGEILFSRVIDGFLPELFKKWVELENRHLVSIVLFGRLEYDRHALEALQRLNSKKSDGPFIDIDEKATYRDFYRVVVTDMASGQWTTILNELKKDFRVFLRDITLHQPQEHNVSEGSAELEAVKDTRTRICGQPTSALRGNILEAINIASSQFASDYIDRDLVRTGISIIVISPSTGVFEVDRQLLDLTSENLTNNGIGIDLVCLSRLPLHSVPLFKWRKGEPKPRTATPDIMLHVQTFPGLYGTNSPISGRTMTLQPSHNSISQSVPQGESVNIAIEDQWVFGIPQWIDVSYWESTRHHRRSSRCKGIQGTSQLCLNPTHTKSFVPRVRMYELQMMGLMEIGLANISIPYLSEEGQSREFDHARPESLLEYHQPKALPQGHLTSPPHPISGSRNKRLAHSPRKGRGLLSVQAMEQGDMYERMDAYDKELFRLRASLKPPKARPESKKTKSNSPLPEEDSNRNVFSHLTSDDGRLDTSDSDTIRSTKGTNTLRSQESSSQLKSVPASMNATDSRLSRSISFALRGLGPSAPRAVASTEINVENAQAEHSGSNLPSDRVSEDASKQQGSPANRKTNRLSVLSLESEGSEKWDNRRSTERQKVTPSRPISIKNALKQNHDSGRRSVKDKDEWDTAHNQAYTMQLKDSETDHEDGETSETEVENETTPLASTSDISPWIKTVKPANPTKNDPDSANGVGRWQHLYPRTRKTSTVKWKSLCTPASIPLTTEEFPSREELETQYAQNSYQVTAIDDRELAEMSKGREWLLREMIGLRLSHGYQLVVGRRVAKSTGSDIVISAEYLMPDKLSEDGVQVHLSMGNTIQKLSCVDSADIQVTRFVRKPPERAPETIRSMTYSPVIRTILSKSYLVRKTTLAGFSEEYPWNLADSHLAGQKDDLPTVYEQLRFWRARFVIIPIEPPASARRTTQSTSEDNEEEIHLLGIRELTKIWQKIRYSPREEKHFKPTTGKPKDPNPLEIIFQTLNPSEVIATEIGKLLATDDGAESKQIQLLPDSELLVRSTSTIAQIAQMLQGEKGVEIANRIWHLKFHRSCFKGDDFTNWLISNFKDIDSREEAVEFGNELMQHGLFNHVSTRHTFKDGNYFYAIALEHRVSRPESRSSWFPGGRRSERSVPATPIAESSLHMSPLSSQAQSGWKGARQVDSQASEKENGEKRHVSVSLTKMIRIDVDHRSPRRSDRPEIVNLHYDRLHNPENCYHLELSWLNVTSKLIEDAIVTWATQSEKYGLRLVEVPIAEACSISDREPFRSPYRIVLKVPPPPPSNVMVYRGPSSLTNTSCAAQASPSTDELIYHKEMLKKFNFVLDLEAASDFPPDVDVTYTWGKLGYHYPQFVHRSGVILAQITDDGEIFLLANRLFNTRSAAAKDLGGRLETKNSSQNRPTPASGIVGLNAQNISPQPSPLVRASSDVLGSRDTFTISGMAAFITPEQIKDELEEFCHDPDKLMAFYKETSERGPPMTRKSASTSSSVLRPVPEYGLENSIPDLRLPASLVATATPSAKNLGMALTKKVSPQPAARERTFSETAIADRSRRTSGDSH